MTPSLKPSWFPRFFALLRQRPAPMLDASPPRADAQASNVVRPQPVPAIGRPIVSVRGITRRFPGVVANDSIDLDVFGGEVQAILGENGSGKSTLMKVLYGFYRPDSGQILFDGQPVTLRSCEDARRRRVGMVFQNFTLIPAFTVVENIALFLPDLGQLLDRRRIIDRIAEVSERYSLHVDPRAAAWQLSIGEQQKVELLKLLLADARVLIFDEPTSVLAPHEVDGLFHVFDKLRADGFAVLFITHKLREALATADRLTVMRKGKIAGTLLRREADEAKLVSLMFGSATPHDVTRRASGGAQEPAAPVLQLRGVSTRDGGEEVHLQDIDLEIRRGQIVGIAGVSGNGQTQLGEVILGLTGCSSGTVVLEGHNATHWPVARIRSHGVALIPESPLSMGVVPGMTVEENMALTDRARYSRPGGLGIDWHRVQEDTERSQQTFGLQLPSMSVPAATLSGGNLQRIILARELGRAPKLVVAFYPTRGLDVPSAAAARELLLATRDAGAGILLVSENLEELFSLSDQLIVLYQGKIVGRSTPEETTVNHVGRLMTGSQV